MTSIELYTDGSCAPNPGPGGWAAILRARKQDGSWYEREISGGNLYTTNNEMEMQAVEEGLKAISSRACSITIYTDSQLVIGYFKFAWKAEKPSLRQAIGRICARRDLFDHRIEWVKIKGHSGNLLNERVDKLAKAARPVPFVTPQGKQISLL